MEDTENEPILEPANENSEAELASDNFWYQLAYLGGTGRPNASPAPDDYPEPSRLQYWNAYFSLVADLESGLNFKEHKSALTEPFYSKLLNLIKDCSTQEEWSYLNPPRIIDFSNVNFTTNLDFSNFCFPWQVTFEGAKFELGADFNSATFGDNALFYKASFLSYAEFGNCSFKGHVNFGNAKLQFITSFRSSKFISDVHFNDVKFSGAIDFSKARFNQTANYCNTVFELDAHFWEANFLEYTNFKSSKFLGVSDFKGSVFKTSIDFTDAIFDDFPPEFFDTTVSDNIVWRNIVFPKVPSDDSKVAKHIDAYERLSLMMSQLGKTHDQHLFWRHEMRVRRRLEKYWPAKFMNKVYDIFCEYGYGFGRALAFWFIHILVFAGVLFIPAPHNWAGAVNALATSFANAHSFLGLNRGPLEEVYSEYGKWEYFNIVWTFQALLGIILLFFLLLTIRNRFKMG